MNNPSHKNVYTEWFVVIILAPTFLLKHVDGQCTNITLRISWSDQIKSPSYPKYESGLNSCWLIKVANGNIIHAQFSDFAMTTNPRDDTFSKDCSDATDWTAFYDGNSTKNEQISKLCAWRREEFTSTTNFMFIQMVTVEQHRGFLLDYYGICEAQQENLNGTIESPHYPNKYPTKAACEWVIDFGYGFNTSITFSVFNLENQQNCTYDFVSLHAGPNKTWPMIGTQYCGYKKPPDFMVHGPLTVTFNSDVDTEYFGFQAHYSSIDLDECLIGNECHTDAVCINTIGSYDCKCKDSFNGDGRSCVWIREFNECEAGVDKCHEFAVCSDSKSEYECECKYGFAGDGFFCEDIDECYKGTHNCHQNATCSNMIGSFLCSCIDVYDGDGVLCRDRDECKLGLDNCHTDAVCINSDGSFMCKCASGYQGDGVYCQDLNECKLRQDDCDVNAGCKNTIGSYVCTCRLGFQGSGQICSDINECQTIGNDCHADAQCSNTIGSFLCECNAGYHGNGIVCEDVEECSTNSHNCHKEAICTNLKGSFACQCNDGFFGNGTGCLDFDECSDNTFNDCHNMSHCLNTYGSYACECMIGLTGDGMRCDDVDECSSGTMNCHQDAQCVNIYAGFSCECVEGFEGNGVQCADVDECQTRADNCSINALCQNEIGSFSCTCNSGYYGSGVECQDVDECATDVHRCHVDSTCVNTKGSYQCKCKHGFEGDGFRCEDVDECSNNLDDCHTQASCENMDGFFACTCDAGYQGNGTWCQDINECGLSDDLCHKQAICKNKEGSYQCLCKSGFHGNGYMCSDTNECEDDVHKCHEFSACSNIYGSYVCSCLEGHEGNGTHCRDVNECTSLHQCDGNAKCINTRGSYKCVCHKGYIGSGLDCSDTNECLSASHNCHNQSTCSNTDGSYICQCNVGFVGNGWLCNDQDECESMQHQCDRKKGICTNTLGSYRCHCKKGMIGDGIKCVEGLMTVYVVIFSILGAVWDNALFDNTSPLFNETSLYVNNQIHLLYKDSPAFISSTVKTFVHGPVRATVFLQLLSSEKEAIRVFVAASKRGNVNELKVDPASIVVTETGDCSPRCSPHAFCAINSSVTEGHCQCQVGLEGNGLHCIDTNECRVMNGGCQQQCVNQYGSYKCLCYSGFSLDEDQRSCSVDLLGYPFDTYCPSGYEQGVDWGETVVGLTTKEACPNNRNDGLAVRLCRKNGIWDQPDMANCVKEGLIDLEDEMKFSFENHMNDTTTNFWNYVHQQLSTVAKETLPAFNIMYAGDILTTKLLLSEILVAVASHVKEFSFDMMNTFLRLFNAALNNVFHSKNHYAWQGLPKAENTISECLALLETMTTVLSDQMIEILELNSIKRPTYVNHMNLSSAGFEEIEILINMVDMRVYDGSSIRTTTMANVTYPGDMFRGEVDKLFKVKGMFRPIGCWADFSRESSVLKLENKHPLLQDNFLNRVDPIEKCGIVAKSMGYSVFAIQEEGWCSSGPRFHETYDKDGTANNCAFGKGGVLANSVYEINKFYTSILTVKHKSLSNLLQQIAKSEIFPDSSTPVNLNGDLVTTRVLKYGPYKDMPTPVSVTFFESIDNETEVRCAQMESVNGSLTYSVDTCSTIVGNYTKIICNCTKLAHQFLVHNYTDKEEVSAGSKGYFQVLSYISFSINTLAVSATVAAHLYYRTSKWDVLFQISLGTKLLLLEMVFIFGVASEWRIDETFCKTLTISFHFLLTSVFSWLFVQSWRSHFRLKNILHQTGTDRAYICVVLGYGYPCLVSILTLALSFEGYGVRATTCWMSSTLFFGFLIAPIAVMFALTIVLLAMVVGAYFSRHLSEDFEEEHSLQLQKEELVSVRDSILACAIFLPVAVATWFFAVLRMTRNSDFNKVAFLILNTLQGLCYVLAYWFLNSEMARKERCTSYSSDGDYPLQSVRVPKHTVLAMRAHKQTYTNGALVTSPKLSETTISNDHKFLENNIVIPNEIFEVQKQWFTKNPDY